MYISVAFGDIQRDTEKFLQLLTAQQLSARTIGNDPARLHHHHPFDLGNQIAEVMRDDDDPCAGLCKVPHRLPKLVLREKVETRARFIQYQRTGIVNQGPRYQQPPRFAGGEFLEVALCKMSRLQLCKDFIRLVRSSRA